MNGVPLTESGFAQMREAGGQEVQVQGEGQQGSACICKLLRLRYVLIGKIVTMGTNHIITGTRYVLMRNNEAINT
jgi:hypothetical protein